MNTPIHPTSTPVIELRDVSKSYGSFEALSGVSLAVTPGTVLCVLGDNGAGKSTLIKVLAGAHKPTSGQVLVDGQPVSMSSPRDALDRGISTVFQNLALVDLMSVWRNFFLGAEVSKTAMLDVRTMRQITSDQLETMGVPLNSVDRMVGTLSGGQRQCVAIARAAYRGARVLVLDEPTAALGVKQAGLVLQLVQHAAERGVGVVMVTHNPAHAHLVGDRFLVLQGGRTVLDAGRDEITQTQLVELMAGGAELGEVREALAQ